MSDLIFCRASVNDLDKIFEVQEMIVKELKNLGREKWFYPYSKEELKEYFANQGKVYVAKDNNKIIACAGLMKEHKWNPSYNLTDEVIKDRYKITDDNTLILDFYFVLPEYRGQHLIKKLFLFGKNDFSGIKYLVGLASKENTYSRNIQKSLGLVPVDSVLIRSGLLRDIFVKEQ